MKSVIFSILLIILLSCNQKTSRKDHSIYWQKNSAEYYALCIQAYNMAKFQIDRALMSYSEKPLAIVADID